MNRAPLPPGQQLAAPGKWPPVGERAPRADNSPWNVTVAGEVAQPFTLCLEELATLPQVERVVDIHCVTRWSKLQVPFRGVTLESLLARAEVGTAARFVSFVARSERSHSTSLPLDDALGLDSFLALWAEGAPLDPARGGPVRLIVPSRYFYKSLKWLERIELLREDRLGYWEGTAGYHNTGDPWREQRYMASGLSKVEARAILADRDISGRDLRSIDASERDLSGLAARGSLLRNADFSGCTLRKACFAGANLTNAHLQRADLREASFVGADLEGADFSGADLRGADLRGTSLFGASFYSTQGTAAKRELIVDRHTQIEDASLAGLTPEQEEFVRGTLAAAQNVANL